RQRLSMILAQKNHLEALSEKTPGFEVQNLSFNSRKSDFAPSLYGDMLVFASARDTITSKGKLYPWNKQPYLDLYITNPNTSGSKPKKFLDNLESSFHDSNTSFVPDSHIVYF